MRTLAQLKLGEAAVIKSFTNQGLALKLIEMGCLPGEKIKLSNIAPFGDPVAFEISGYVLSMRKAEASTVVLEE
jgi:ferrous iron transport protein A